MMRFSTAKSLEEQTECYSIIVVMVNYLYVNRFKKHKICSVGEVGCGVVWLGVV